MHNTLLVADIMTHEPITIKSEASLFDCCKKMVNKRVGSLLLVDKNNEKILKGIICGRDILWALVKTSSKDLESIQAQDIAPKKIIKISPFTKVSDAIRKMKNQKLERLPVTKRNALVGMITIKDILNFQPEIYPELEEFSKIREESNKMKRIQEAKSRTPIRGEGICEECGSQGELYRIDGMLVCSDCLDD